MAPESKLLTGNDTIHFLSPREVQSQIESANSSIQDTQERMADFTRGLYPNYTGFERRQEIRGLQARIKRDEERLELLRKALENPALAITYEDLGIQIIHASAVHISGGKPDPEKVVIEGKPMKKNGWKLW